MGQGQEFKTRTQPDVEIQERGEIFFFYRPKIEKEEAHSADDVQRLYIVLKVESGERPVEEKQDPHSGKEAASASASASGNTEGGRGTQVVINNFLTTLKVNIEKQPLLRLIVMGRKSLPHVSERGRPYWGFVELVTTSIEHVKTALKGEEYDTSTRGHRHNPPARPLGEGVYRILRHTNPGGRKRSMHTHLIYKLEFPSQDDLHEPQQALNIERQASYIVQIKNPLQHQVQDTNTSNSTSASDHSQGRRHGGFGLQNKRKAKFPAHLQRLFGHLRYAPADPPDLLNYEGCEFLLISASDDIQEELGLDLHTDCEFNDECCSDLVHTFGDTEVSTDALFKGTWV